MDAELMQLMARFKLRLLRALNVKVDTYRFVAEREYAMQILQIADQADDEDLIVLAMQVSDHLGWLDKASAPEPAKHVPPKSSPNPPAEEKDRYMFGARG